MESPEISPKISREALAKYLSRRVEELTEMKRYLDQRRFDDIAMLSHKIKGSASTFGLDGVGRIAEMLEVKAESSAVPEVSELIGQMEEEVNGAIKSLN